MVAPVIASKSSNVSSINATTNVVGAPAGIVDGDLLLYVLVLDTNPTSIVVPTGFTEITPADGDKAPSNTATLVVAWKIASSESGSYTSTWTNGEHSVAFMYRITGAISGSEIQDPSSTNSGEDTTAIGLGFNTDRNNSLAVACTVGDTDVLGSGENGTGWSNEDRAATSGGGPSVTGAVSIKSIASAGATENSSRTLSSADGWATRLIAIRSVDIRTLTHTTDSFLVERHVDHTTDSLLKKLDNTLSHTTDCLLSNIRTLTHTTDSLLTLRPLLDHTTDSLLKKLDNTLSHTTDCLLNVVNTVTHTTDSLLKKIGDEVTHTTDSLLKKLDNEVSHTTDSVLKSLDNEVSHTTDSLLKAIQTLSHTTDSYLIQTITRTRDHTTDSLLKKLGNTLSHTTDCFIAPAGGVISKKIEADLCVTDETTEDLCVKEELEVDLCA